MNHYVEELREIADYLAGYYPDWARQVDDGADEILNLQSRLEASEKYAEERHNTVLSMLKANMQMVLKVDRAEYERDVWKSKAEVSGKEACELRRRLDAPQYQEVQRAHDLAWQIQDERDAALDEVRDLTIELALARKERDEMKNFLFGLTIRSDIRLKEEDYINMNAMIGSMETPPRVLGQLDGPSSVLARMKSAAIEKGKQ